MLGTEQEKGKRQDPPETQAWQHSQSTQNARSPGYLAITGALNVVCSLVTQRLAIALMAFDSVHGLEQGLALALEQALDRLGNAAAFQNVAAGAVDGHEKILEFGELEKGES